MISDRFLALGEYAGAGLYEERERSLFYRKSLGIRRYYENCALSEYHGEFLYPSGILPQNMRIAPFYILGLCMDYPQVKQQDSELADLFVSDFLQYQSTVPPVHTVAGNMYIHSMPHYERILKEGLLSYKERIIKIRDKDMCDGLIHLIYAIECYVNRCVEYLESISADKKLINALKQVPMQPARNIYEALVCWNFVMYLDNCDNLGCLAAGLYPYYNGENIVEILKNLYDNLDVNCGYSMSLNTDYNKLTIQCLEAAKGKRRPMIELFVNENTPDEVWQKAFEVIRSGGGQPAFYNEKVLLGGLKNKFPTLTDSDAKCFCGGGCTESMIAGLSNVGSLDAGINLLYILENVMYTRLPLVKNFDEFYNLFISEVQSAIDKVTREISNSQKQRAKYNPLPMRTLLIDDCIDSGLDYNNGGARYKWSIINFAGLINVIDSLLVIKSFVFDNKTLTAEKLLGYLKANDTQFLYNARKNADCFGKDITAVNSFINKISSNIFSMLDNKKPYIGEGFLPASIQFMSQVMAGENIGATPDGRESGAPLCDSLAAIFGKDVNGPTALLNSVAALDLKRVLGIPVLNFNVKPDFDGKILKALITGYFQSGGIQMQLTCISKEMLMEAYENLDLHRNLIVRVGGYSEYFNNLSDDLKKMVINRTVQAI